jgi:ATP-dependent Lon protease
MEIAKRYLIPKQRKAAGLKSSEVQFTTDALRGLINSYARDAGVRTLENNLKKIFRKVAVEFVRNDEAKDVKKRSVKKSRTKKVITPHCLQEFLGKPLFISDRYYETPPIGVAVGLAWTSHGGATLYVESIKVSAEKTDMKLTGQAGQVMKESSEIAWTFVHGSMHKYAPGHTFFEKSQVHIHIPEGATPKDGPSAGITMVSSLLSLLLGIPLKTDLGMTGELTLTGRILPIGGVKEKLVAAKRSGLTTIILPKGNLRDIDDLPKQVKEGIELLFVEHYDEVFAIAFPGVSLGGNL